MSLTTAKTNVVALAALAMVLLGAAIGIGSGFVTSRWQANSLIGATAKVSSTSVAESCTPSRAHGLRVVVTGHAGFVGFHTSARLAQRGDGVVGIDSFNSYYPSSLKHARASVLYSQHGVHSVHADVADASALQRVFGACAPTHVLHLAAQAGVRHARKDPQSYVHANVRAFVTLEEELVKLSPIPPLIFASSSSVYGGNEKVPFAENDCTEKQSSLYAATKKASEALSHTYASVYGVSTTALRFFTVYGSYGRPDMAYFSFARSIVKGETIVVFQGPKQSELERDMTYIDDVVDGTVASLDTAPKSGFPFSYRVYNLGNTQPVKVSKLVQTLEKHLDKKANVQYKPLPNTGDVLKTHADVSKARSELGYEPKTSIDDGIKAFVQWFSSYFYDKNGNEQRSLGTYTPP